MSRNTRAASVSVISNVSLLGLKLAVGIFTGSVAVLSAAMDSLNDLAASTIAFFSVRAAEKPPDVEHPYGHGKIENVSSAVQAILIFMAAIYIVYEAVGKILTPRPIQAINLGLVVMGVTAGVDVVVSRYLLSVARETDSAAIRADAYHLTTDVWTAVAVFVGLILIEFTGILLFDPIVALGVAAAIIWVAVRLVTESAGVLLDVRLPESELRQLEDIVMKTPKVVGYHKLRTRKAGPTREIDLHLILPANMELVEAHQIAQDVEDRMREAFANTTVVTHIEPDTIDVTGQPDTEMRRRPPPRRTRRSRTPRTPRPPSEGE